MSWLTGCSKRLRKSVVSSSLQAALNNKKSIPALAPAAVSSWSTPTLKPLIKNLVFSARFPNLSSAPSASSAVEWVWLWLSQAVLLILNSCFVKIAFPLRNQSAFISFYQRYQRRGFWLWFRYTVKTLIKNLVFLARFPRLSSAPSASSAVKLGFVVARPGCTTTHQILLSLRRILKLPFTNLVLCDLCFA